MSDDDLDQGHMMRALHVLRDLPQEINDSLSFALGALFSHPREDAREIVIEQIFKAAVAMRRHLDAGDETAPCGICDAEKEAST